MKDNRIEKCRITNIRRINMENIWGSVKDSLRNDEYETHINLHYDDIASDDKKILKTVCESQANDVLIDEEAIFRIKKGFDGKDVAEFVTFVDRTFLTRAESKELAEYNRMQLEAKCADLQKELKVHSLALRLFVDATFFCFNKRKSKKLIKKLQDDFSARTSMKYMVGVRPFINEKYEQAYKLLMNEVNDKQYSSFYYIQNIRKKNDNKK